MLTDKSFGFVDGKSFFLGGLRMASPWAEDGKSFGSEDGKSWLEDGKSRNKEAYFGWMTFLKKLDAINDFLLLSCLCCCCCLCCC